MGRHHHLLGGLGIVALAVLAGSSLAGCGTITNSTSTHRIGSAPYTQGSGNVTTETRDLGSFHAVSADRGITVMVASGSKSSAAVTADDNLLSMIVTTVDANGTLSVRTQGNLETHNDLNVVVTAAGPIDRLSADNGSTLDSENVEAESLTASAGNGSTLRAGGRATNLTVSATTGSTADLRDVEAESATVDAQTGSTAFVRATKSADGNCAGGSTVVLHGSPASVTVGHDTSSTVRTE